jgi:hypothetical protein
MVHQAAGLRFRSETVGPYQPVTKRPLSFPVGVILEIHREQASLRLYEIE